MSEPSASQRTDLLGNEEQFRLLDEATEECTIFLLGLDGTVISWSNGAECMKGYAEEEILGTHFSVFYPPEDVEAGVPEKALETAAREGQWTSEGRRVRKDGTRFWGRERITTLTSDEGQICGFANVTRDLTGQKEQEEALRRSEERFRRLGQDLHDVVASQLTGVSIMLDGLARQETGNSELAGRIREIRELVAESCEDIRQLSRGLTPAGLSEGNLPAALERLVENTDGGRLNLGPRTAEARPEDLPEGPSSEPLKGGALEGDVATHLYCIAQEATTNARKYAEADEIAICLRKEDGAFVLEVEDDGVGFDPEGVEKEESLGLRTMRYRAELLGADFAVESRPGEGTCVRCRLPV